MTRIGPYHHCHPEIRWDEYEFIASFGWSHDRIAERLGVCAESLRVALHRRAGKARAGAGKDARTGEAAA